MARKTTVYFYERGKKRVMTNVYKKEFYVGGPQSQGDFKLPERKSG